LVVGSDDSGRLENRTKEEASRDLERGVTARWKAEKPAPGFGVGFGFRLGADRDSG
jgi:hypothetical protein